MKEKNNNAIDAQSILSKNGISRTQFRTELLNFFYSSNKSLSVDDILKCKIVATIVNGEMVYKDF